MQLRQEIEVALIPLLLKLTVHPHTGLALQHKDSSLGTHWSSLHCLSHALMAPLAMLHSLHLSCEEDVCGVQEYTVIVDLTATWDCEAWVHNPMADRWCTRHLLLHTYMLL